MTSRDIYKKILLDIVSRCSEQIVDKETIDDIKSSISANIKVGIEELQDALPDRHFPERSYYLVVSNILSIISDEDSANIDDEVQLVPRHFLFEVNRREHLQYLKRIVTTQKPFIVTTISLKNHSYPDFNKEQDLWKAIERIWCSIEPASAEAEDFWASMKTRTPNKYYLADDDINENTTSEKAWSKFAFAYYNKVNTESFPIPEKLEVKSHDFVEKLSYKESGPYQQFFDIYDVLNQAKHARDKLSYFLNLYQIVEMLAYRMKFIRLLPHNNDLDCSLIRRIESMTDSFKENEKTVIVGAINELFPNLSTRLYAEPVPPETIRNDSCLTEKCKLSLSNWFQVSVDEQGKYTNIVLSSLIYALRNSIVHNKETEFHCTYNNISQYEDCIGILDFLIDEMEHGILDLIETETVSNPVAYKKESVLLY